jgi:uncharacterized repeat protein (TIGR03843 family)
VVEVVGRFAAASNATLLGVTASGERVIYKPTAGERPLWDFPAGTLAHREVLTFEMSRTMGLDVVPETVIGSGLFGPGAVQRFVTSDDDFDPLPLVRTGDGRLWPIALLDIVCNNADRKVGHLLGGEDHIYAIDHGLTFHPEDKLRSVLWAFAGRLVPATLLASLERAGESVAGSLGDVVEARLGLAERRALAGRIAALLTSRVHPEPPDDRPPIPWPPY